MLSINDYLLVPPDWAGAISLKRRWQTSIQTSVTGVEKRSALFTWPRRVLSYSLVSMDARESNYVKRKVFKNVHNIWGIPLWPDRTSLTAQAASGQPILTVGSTTNRYFEVGAPCIILGNQTSFEVGEIQSVSATQITLTSNLVSTWALGVDVYPILQARLNAEQKLSMTTSTVGTVNVVAQEAFDGNITRIIGSSSDFPFYRHTQIYNTEPNWISGLGQDFSHPYALFRELGKGFSFSNYAETTFKLSGKFSNYSKQEVQDTVNFFDVMMGRWGQFWIPSWHNDIVVTSAFGAGDQTLDIEDIEYSSYWMNEHMGRYIFILFPDGTEKYKRIVQAPTSTSITLELPVGKACADSELGGLLVSFLYLVRFDIDEMEVKYLSEEIGDNNAIAFKTIFSEADEVLYTTTTTTTSTTTTTTTSTSTTTTTTAPPPPPGNLFAMNDTNLIFKLSGISATILDSWEPPANNNTYGLTNDGTNLIYAGQDWDRIYKHDGGKHPILDSFPSPSITPYGATFDGTNLITCDSQTDRIYVHSGVTSTISDSFASTGTFPRIPCGLAYDGANLISVDQTADKIYVHNGISVTITTSFACPSTIPSGLTYDTVNSDLISCDYLSDQIYVHSGTTSVINDSFSSPAGNPRGLAFDGTNLISIDGGWDRIFKHSGVTETILDSYTRNAGNSSGLTYDTNTGNLISCADADTHAIYVHRGTLPPVLDSFAAPDLNLSGLAFDGTNLISVDENDIIYIHTGISAVISSTFAAPDTSTWDMTYDGSHLISCGYTTKKIYVHSGVTDTIFDSFTSPGVCPAGAAWDGTNLITSDRCTDRIYKHSGVTATITDSFAAPAGDVYGLTCLPITTTTTT